MIRIRGAAVLGLSAGLVAVLALNGGLAHAQQITGRITGRVADKDSGQALSGVTVIVQGPQGEDASLTDAAGSYYFSTLPVGTYTIRFYVANSPSYAEQGGVVVAADKTVRVNARIAGQAAAAAAEQTYVINKKPPAIDIGTTRLGPTFDSNFVGGVPVGQNFGDIIEKAPGAFVDRTGSVSIGGATGLENTYIVDGLNVTGTEFGNIDTNAASTSGGTNLPLEFMDQVSVSSGGYNAEFGGAMGGVISAVTKSGTNELRGSAFTYWAPYQMAAQPNLVTRYGVSISTLRKPDFDTTVGTEVGGPIIKNKLFYWFGFAPRFQKTHVFRYVNEIESGADGTLTTGPEVTDGRRRIDENRNTYSYGGKIDYVPAADHRLTVSIFGSPSSATGLRAFSGIEAFSDPSWARESVTRNTTDTMARWTSKLFDRKWQIEADVGLHRESFDNSSANPALNSVNQEEWWNTNLYDREQLAACAPGPDGKSPCPVDEYHSGGFGQAKKFDANRWMADIKSTHAFEAAGHHEVKYGWHLELTQFNQDRYYSGPPDAHALVIHNPPWAPGSIVSQNFFTLQPGERPDQFADHPWDLTTDPRYRDHLPADVKSIINSFFLQESYSPLPNLTVNAGVRLEMQKMYDYKDAGFLSLQNLGPRVGVVYDPTNEGRSKIFAHYGRFFEAVPMNLAARYFGGEGIAQTIYDPKTCQTDPNTWTGGANEFRNCTANQDPSSYYIFNNGKNYPVQPNLQGQYHNEIVAGVHHEVTEDMVVGIDYTHRWLGTIIEDGTTDGNTYVLANPGNVPPAAIADYQHQVDMYQAQVNAATDATALAQAKSNLQGAQTQLNNLKGLAAEPKPERTFDALTLFVDKRFSRRWMAHASYTYSRLIGNYEGLYQEHTDYFAPNGSAAYDYPDMLLNARGPLPNDHPHSARLDGFYTQPLGKGSLVFGLGFSARSGQPRNYYAALGGYGGVVHLLPRGSAGRTPPITQLDGKIAYRVPLTAKTGLEAFIDFFNIFNQQTVLRTDDDYTYDSAAAIVNGTPTDLKYAKNGFTGAPIAVNPNFGHATAYQAPFHGRLGVRVTF
jgi:hypothetical protein